MFRTNAEKLDYLLTLTDTSNALLARYLRFDASYISRIRSGKRGLPASEDFLSSVCAYFARHIHEPDQRRAAASALGLDTPWPEVEAEAASLLADWFRSSEPDHDPVARLIAAMAAPMRFPADNAAYRPGSGSTAAAACFYGRSGKRDAVITFLQDLVRSGRSHTLLLTSDEDMTWLYEDPAFVRTWSELMGTLIKSGSRIRIIHTVSRDAGEMWEAVEKWLPLYRSGAIEPYYYPRLRDGLMRRTLFIASGHSAISAVSVQGQPEDGLNLLLDEPQAVRALESEFNAFLTLCEPLMEIARPRERRSLSPLLEALLNTPGRVLALCTQGFLLAVNASFGALVIRSEAPYIVFSLKEPRMVAAVETYILQMTDGAPDEKAMRHLVETYLSDTQTAPPA